MEVFSKILTKTDVDKRLAIPTDCLKHFRFDKNKDSESLQVMDENGGIWNLRCYTRRRGYSKPVLSSGWRQFVTCSGIRAGDRVNFYIDYKQEVSYRIEVKRKFMIFGSECWGNLQPDLEKRTKAESEAEAEAEVVEVQTSNFEQTAAAEA
ncbi:hypothetical protein REPUB_Repub03eG0228400 [Reevesia pubescens]